MSTLNSPQIRKQHILGDIATALSFYQSSYLISEARVRYIKLEYETMIVGPLQRGILPYLRHQPCWRNIFCSTSALALAAFALSTFVLVMSWFLKEVTRTHQKHRILFREISINRAEVSLWRARDVLKDSLWSVHTHKSWHSTLSCCLFHWTFFGMLFSIRSQELYSTRLLPASTDNSCVHRDLRQIQPQSYTYGQHLTSSTANIVMLR